MTIYMYIFHLQQMTEESLGGIPHRVRLLERHSRVWPDDDELHLARLHHGCLSGCICRQQVSSGFTHVAFHEGSQTALWCVCGSDLQHQSNDRLTDVEDDISSSSSDEEDEQQEVVNDVELDPDKSSSGQSTAAVKPKPHPVKKLQPWVLLQTLPTSSGIFGNMIMHRPSCLVFITYCRGVQLTELVIMHFCRLSCGWHSMWLVT